MACLGCRRYSTGTDINGKQHVRSAMTTTTSPAREVIERGDDDDYDDYHDDGDGDNDEDTEEVGDEGDSGRQQRRQIWATMANAVKDTPAAIHERENASVGYVAVGTLSRRAECAAARTAAS